MRRLAIVFCLFAAGPGCRGKVPANAAFVAGDNEGSLSFGGRDRGYLLHLPPAYDGKRPLPLVIALHGGGGHGKNASAMSGLSALADKAGVAVVYPNGTGRFEERLLTWNSGNCCGYALDNKIDDVGFLRALLDELGPKLPVDAKRVYATGISNGGMMSYRLACELADRVAGIAPVAGALNVPDCRPSQPVSVIAFHGTADEHVLYEGGAPRKRADPHPREDRSFADAVAFWKVKNRCEGPPRREEKGEVTREEYAGCEGGAAVVAYTIKGGGHSWPGGVKGHAGGDEPSGALSASELMLRFFLEHPRP
jgi:polyhydroxybutyrate depolymerase